MKKKVKKLSAQLIQALRNMYEPITFQNAFNLVYEKQVPNTGIILLSGDASFVKKKKPVEKIEPGSLLGIHHLVNNEQVRYGCMVEEDAEVILLQKTDIKEALKNRKSILNKVLKDGL
jgi:signal-transduction protein with cAMP-binding, CBS, and nucleotidyltransferase domain